MCTCSDGDQKDAVGEIERAVGEEKGCDKAGKVKTSCVIHADSHGLGHQEAPELTDLSCFVIRPAMLLPSLFHRSLRIEPLIGRIGRSQALLHTIWHIKCALISEHDVSTPRISKLETRQPSN
ncbi:unnamed protein product [Protopolystoma xenopodis]|uniref:Uncharacterized protein n=1 Tax=Protopolystoma xenopodis TaxID=117903 RepID=A0A3S5BST9_9PLAT|nr:unnamed protein product [Protopolystoma xenopodis]